MNFFVIPPVAHKELALHSDGLYVLAHLYLKYDAYREFCLEQKRMGTYIVLDNSAAERALVTEDVLIQITKELMPNEVIAPDVLFDFKQTNFNMFSFIERMDEQSLLGKVKIFGCPQGSTQSDWLDSYYLMLCNKFVDVIGLSKIAVPFAFLGKTNDEGIKEARHKAVDALQELGWLKKPIHLLGMGEADEYQYYKNIPQIRSTDSCYSVLAAMNGISFEDQNFTRVPTPHDYFERSMDLDQITLAQRNITWMAQALHSSADMI
jgi:hypothetical protein